MAGITKGKWKVAEGYQSAALVESDNTMAILILTEDLEEAKANARLIAAAPQTKEQRDALLSAAKEAEEWLLEDSKVREQVKDAIALCKDSEDV